MPSDPIGRLFGAPPLAGLRRIGLPMRLLDDATQKQGGDMARARDDLRVERRKRFVAALAKTGDPVQAAKDSGHPAERALETLRDLGFTLTVLEKKLDVAA